MAKTYGELTQRRLALIAEGTAIAKKDSPAEGDAGRIAAIEVELDQIETDRNAIVEQMSMAAAGEAGRVEAAVKAAEKRAGDIVSACELAGSSLKVAHDFIASGKSVDDVVAALKADRVATDQEINPRRTAGADAPDTRGAWDKAIGKVNARMPGKAA